MSKLKLTMFDTIDSELQSLWSDFATEYSKVDHGLRSNPVTGTVFKEQTLYKIFVDNKTAGFAKLQHNVNNHGETDIELHLVYIKPEFRGQGVAKAVYKEFINTGTVMISLSWWRIDTLKKIDYWNSVGFKFIQINPGQLGTDKALAYLSTEGGLGPMFMSLDKRNVTKARLEQTRIAKKMAKKSSYQSVSEILENHYKARLAA